MSSLEKQIDLLARIGTSPYPPNECRKCGLVAINTNYMVNGKFAFSQHHVPLGSLTFEDGSFICSVCPDNMQSMVDLVKEVKAFNERTQQPGKQ